MASKIGIKLADGTFFPILDEDALSEQSLELTTVRENQESVQINLFKQVDETEPEYIGSLIVEDVSTGAAGDPTINLKIKLDEEKNLSAEAVDEGSGSHQSLKVSLKNLDEASLDGIDFDFTSFDDSTGFESNDDDYFIKEDDALSFDDSLESRADSQLYGQNEEKSEKKKMPLWLIIVIIILCITALVFAILLLTKKMPFADKDKIASAPEKVEQVQEPKKDVNATTSNAPQENAEEKAAAEAKRKAEEEERQKAAAEAQKKAEEEAKQKAEEEAKQKAKQKAEAEAKKKAEEEAKQKADAKKKADAQKKSNVNSKGVVKYKVKWGDTLWDLSETYYKTPWLYKKIADYNKIKNPNLIIAGTYIDIPPK